MLLTFVIFVVVVGGGGVGYYCLCGCLEHVDFIGKDQTGVVIASVANAPGRDEFRTLIINKEVCRCCSCYCCCR